MQGNCSIAFVGCVQEGKECLQEILDAGGNVTAIFTFDEEMAAKTSGAVPFDDLAASYNIPLYKIKNTNTPEAVEIIRQVTPDVIFVIGWTRLVSADVLAIPEYGCIGMHASLLPKYRGRAPVNWALINNETVTGNTMILLDDGVDTGDILLQRTIPITLADTCKTLYDKVAQAGREMIREILPYLDRGELPRSPQNHSEATVMPKRTPEDGLINWEKTSLELYNWVRALTHPYPGAFTVFAGRKLFIWEAQVTHHSTNNKSMRKFKPGTVVALTDGITVATGGDELLTLRRLNFEGEAERAWSDFLESHTLEVGAVLTDNIN